MGRSVRGRRVPCAFKRELKASCHLAGCASLRRIAPDPVAFVLVRAAPLFNPTVPPSSVSFQPDRVEDKLAVIGAAIFEGLSVMRSCGSFSMNFGASASSVSGELAFRQPISLQRAGEAS